MARRPAETISVLTYRTGVQDANLAGNVHGGWVMKLCDDVAVIAATRLAGGRVVTAAVDAMQFRAPVKVGDVITLRATVNATWRTSMEVGVRVDAEHVPTGELTHTCTAYLTMVALGEDEKPVLLPALEPETPEDERRRRDAEPPPRDPARRAGRAAPRHGLAPRYDSRPAHTVTLSTGRPAFVATSHAAWSWFSVQTSRTAMVAPSRSIVQPACFAAASSADRCSPSSKPSGNVTSNGSDPCGRSRLGMRKA